MATRKERKLGAGGGRFIAFGADAVVIGAVLALAARRRDRHRRRQALLGAIPVAVGTAGVEQHARKRRPFA